MPKKITLDRDEVQKVYNELGNLHKVAAVFGISRPALVRFMDANGVHRQQNGEFFISKDELEKAYMEAKSTRVLAERYHVCRSVIKRLCKQHNIELEARPPMERLVPDIQRMTENGLDNFQIADELDLTPGYINQIAREHGIKINFRFHTGHTITHHGYKKLYMPDHVDADSKGYVHEHRYVLAKHLGLESIPKDKVVHHINGEKQDNRPENLVMMTLDEHSKLHRDQH